jgi:hypothetical protein
MMLKILSIVIMLISIPVQFAYARMVSDPVNGFSVEIPDEWQEIPQAVFDHAIDTAYKTEKGYFLKGYEPASHTRSFQYPFIIFQRIPYNSGINLTTITESQLKEITAGYTGVPVTEVKQSPTPTASSVLTSVFGQSQTYFTSPPGFIIDEIATIDTGEKTHKYIIGLVGKDHCNAIIVFGLQTDTASIQPIVNSIVSSFRQDASQQVTYRENKSSMTQAIDIFVLAVGLGALIWVWAKRRRTMRPLLS